MQSFNVRLPAPILMARNSFLAFGAVAILYLGLILWWICFFSMKLARYDCSLMASLRLLVIQLRSLK